MGDIKKVWLLYLKGFLLFLTGFISSLLLVLLNLKFKKNNKKEDIKPVKKSKKAFK